MSVAVLGGTPNSAPKVQNVKDLLLSHKKVIDFREGVGVNKDEDDTDIPNNSISVCVTGCNCRWLREVL